MDDFDAAHGICTGSAELFCQPAAVLARVNAEDAPSSPFFKQPAEEQSGRTKPNDGN
jgi:hypothetical protein